MYQIDLTKPCSIYFVGIGGVSMSGLAEILADAGFRVSGSDRAPSELCSHLEQMGIHIFYGQRKENISPELDCAVLTAAIGHDNPEYIALTELGIPMLTRGQLLGQLMRHYHTPIAVSGTHGKTTTTSMVSEILLQAGVDPTLSIGGIYPPIQGNTRVGGKEYFVLEACEYTNSFLSFFPRISIILNIEEDHLDFFKDLADIRSSFHRFAKLLPKDGALIINGAIENPDEITEDLACPVYTYDGALNSLSEGQAGTYAAEKSVGTWVADASDEVVQITFRNAATDNSQVRFTSLMVEYADEAATPLKLTIPSGGLATYYDSQPYVMPAGLTGHVVNSVSASSESAVGTLQTEAKYAAGMVVPPCEPLVLSGMAGGYDAVRRGTIDEPTHQMLLGTALDTMVSSSASGERCYTLRANEKGETAQMGFFVRQPAEGPLSIAAHECWLTLPSALGYEALLFDHVLLGIGQTNRGSHAPLGRIYDLGGRMVEKHERGLFIVNGQKRMMR